MRILVTAGASGGHIFPAWGFFQAFKIKYPRADFCFVLSRRSAHQAFLPQGVCIRYIWVTPFFFKRPREWVRFFWNILKSVFETFFIIIEYRPDMVVGFGGIESVFPVLLGWFFRIPTLIHEQNVVPGKANKLLSYCVDKIAVSFEETKGEFLKNIEKVVVSGNPLRQEFQESIPEQKALSFFGFSPDYLTILVVGGSQGSQTINHSFIRSLSLVECLDTLQVIHISGERDLISVQQQYDRLPCRAKVYAFLPQMHYAYRCADFVVARAGATTIAELSFFKVPALLVPYPYASMHQLCNAQVLAKRNAALVISDNDMQQGKIGEILRSLITQPKKLEAMRAGFGDFSMGSSGSELVKEARVLLDAGV
ncbi:MAG: UDP-N-acetylglucosamine--N-acetylmuramyl-(pentapeptide) pyrophosphoryl-undecaprenol N-acetylglucosamine transferase [Candidatus Omnitrophica bacterium]|nr:UDP-N-acetylglucosamine--N-acetylmuramyl-(pentapeptide) pyrophosphoryl-undecaprenol N-acetylglucosamine transferase [Candidatus Omnitrophota bacterium]